MTISRLFRVISTCFALFAFPAVSFAADTCAENQMIIDGACVEPRFTITTTNMAAESTFSFKISATGTFYVDFDDGRGVQKIVRTNNIAYTTYTSAAYANAGTHIIKMYGDATGYSTSYHTAAISFVNNTNIKSVDGSLGAIFGGSTKNMFFQTFYGCTSLQYISGNLFYGVTDSAESMFDSTFYGCTSLKEIHATLFSGVNGSAESMFSYTFRGCTSLESLPDGLFSGVKGSANDMFGNTFNGCTSLKKIPDTLFSGVNGSAENMFVSTFYRCTSLESLPDGLFSGVSGSAGSMFRNTFFGCTSLKSLPKGLFKNIEGRPATGAFNGTFGYCSDLSGYIPSDMFEKMDSTDFDSATMSGIFTNTALDTQCPAGTYQYITGFESAWSGKVACVPCPDGYTSDVGAVTENQCYKTCEKQCVQQLCPEHSVNCSTQTESITGTEYFGGTCNAQETVCNIEFDCEVGYDKLSFVDTLVRNMDLIYDAAETWDECALNGIGNACDVLPAGQYAIEFDNTNGSPLQHTLFTTTCNNVAGDDTDSGLRINQGADFVQETSGSYCWERVVSLNGSPVSSSWVYNREYESATDCAAYCGNSKPTDVAYALAMATNTNLCSPHVYTVTYDCNGGTGDTTDSATYTAIFTPRTDVCAKANYKFVGWAIDDTPVGDEFAWNYTADKKLVAQWEKVDCAENQMIIDGACVEPEFTIITTNMAAGTVFEFTISATGTYYIDWGDDSDIEIIEKTDTTYTPYSHTYADGGVHTIGMYGGATKYALSRAAISFSGNKNIVTLGGSLGKIFGGSARSMFYQTFMDCTSLQSIPESLFSGVTVTNPQIFRSTFKGCTSLESLPSGLFKNITNDGSLGNGMFGETFAGCSKLSGYIPSDMFAGLDVTDYTSGPMTDIFAGTNLDTVCPAGMYQYITGFESDWSGKVSCSTCPEGTTIAPSGTSCICNNGDAFVNGACIEPEFTITTTDMAEYTKFTMMISAAGTYYIDWGDGTSKVIKKTNTQDTEYNHIYEKAGVYTIKMAGDATEYGRTAAISFADNTNIAALGGSLGAIIGGPARTYMFSAAFYGCTSLKSIPETLFSDISGSASQMFLLTFANCTSLQEIPDGLFSDVTGSAESMFVYTFANCTSLKSLPNGLFKNIEGRPADKAFNGTFYGCSKLSGYIPSDMFAGLDNTDYTSGSMTDIFAGTNLDTVCPAGTYQYITGFESDWSGKVSCSLCPGGYTSDVGATAENMCYKTCSIPCTQQPCPENSINCENAITSTFGKQYYGGTCDVAATTCKITFDCASGHYMNNGMCAPCPDGMCSINKPCSPSANATGETTCQYNANTGDYSDCNECRFVSCNDGYQYINGECKIVVTCNPGQYLPAGASECAPCPAGSYCTGNTTYIYDPNYNQGISGSCDSGSYSSAGASECTECPFVTDPYGGLFVDVYSYGGSIDTCVATYEYLPEYMVEMLGITVQDAIDMLGYNPDSDANKRGLFAAQCHYDTVTQQYTKDCAGQIAMCEGGYYTNVGINEEFGLPYLEASTLEEMLNTYCVPAEPGYWSPGLPHTDFENITQEEVSLTWVRNACPAGTTSAAGASDISHCVGGRTLHIGDDITMNLTTIRPTTPRVMVFQVLNELYYGGLSDTEKTINKNTDKKFRIFFDNKDYWLHDYTVE